MKLIKVYTVELTVEEKNNAIREIQTGFIYNDERQGPYSLLHLICSRFFDFADEDRSGG